MMENVSAEALREAERFPYAADADTLFELGLAYSLGAEGVPDLVTAQKWFCLAAMKGSTPARICRRELAREMTAEDLAEAQRQAGAWIKPH